MYGLIIYIPAMPGMLIRFIFLKLFTKSCRGFVWLQPRVELVNIRKIIFGKNVGINSGTYINAVGGLDIGDYVLIGPNVTISSGMHPIDKGTNSIYEKQTVFKKIIIEDDVWLGANVVIMPGVVLKTGSVVGANSVVTKSTLAYSVNVGVPSRFIRYRS